MLNQPLMDKLRELRLSGFRAALEEQTTSTQYAALSFEERLGMLVDRECERRENNRVKRALKAARFPDPAATIENLDFEPERGLKRRVILELAQGEWIRHGLNSLVLGPTGVGKTFLGCALGHSACRQGHRVRYLRLPRFVEDCELAHAEASFPKLLRGLQRTHLLILDDWLRDPLTGPQTRDLADVLEDRYGRLSTLV
ncbi:MAG: ATP-binding protein, partial [Dehalococcoidia bacterium]